MLCWLNRTSQSVRHLVTIIVLNEILTDTLLVASTIEHTRELYDSGRSLLRQMVEQTHKVSDTL